MIIIIVTYKNDTFQCTDRMNSDAQTLRFDLNNKQDITAFLSTYQTNFPLSDIILNQANRNGWTIGHRIASYQNAATTQQYLTLLSTVGAQDPTTVLKILNQADREYQTIGHIIARWQDAATTQQYLTLLSTVDAQDPTAVLKILNQESSEGWTIGHIIARWQNAATTQQYLTLLSTVDAQDPTAVLKILNQETRNGGRPFSSWTIKYLIGQYQSSLETDRIVELENNMKSEALSLSNNTQQTGSSSFTLFNIWGPKSSPAAVEVEMVPLRTAKVAMPPNS
jgi:hypothetical protein